jgi:hypothetical protein
VKKIPEIRDETMSFGIVVVRTEDCDEIVVLFENPANSDEGIGVNFDVGIDEYHSLTRRLANAHIARARGTRDSRIVKNA